MAYKITDACINCGVCAGECTVEAISEADGKHVIDAENASTAELAQELALLTHHRLNN